MPGFLPGHVPLQPLQPHPQPPPAFFLFQMFLTANAAIPKTTAPTAAVDIMLLAARAICIPSFLD